MLPTLDTPRLRLRPLRAEDAPDYFARLGRDSRVSRYMLWEPHTDLSQAEQLIAHQLRGYELGLSFRWAITFPEEDRLIGIMALIWKDEEDGHRSWSAAYMLAPAFWGQGCAAEALEAALGYGFTALDIPAVTIDHFVENPASGAVLRKAGLQYSRTVPGKYVKNGTSHDAVEYTITKAQWLRR